MKRKKIMIMATVGLLCLICSPVWAAPFWDLSVGTVFNYLMYWEDQTSNESVTWTSSFSVIDDVEFEGQNYFHTVWWNRENDGNSENYHFRVTDNAVYSWSGAEEELLYQAAPVGTSWQAGYDRDRYTVIDTNYLLEVPFGSGEMMSAYLYKVEETEPDEIGEGADYVAVVPGLGYVGMTASYDEAGNFHEWATLINITQPEEHSGSAPVPEPGTLFLLGTGILSMAGIYRRKSIKI